MKSHSAMNFCLEKKKHIQFSLCVSVSISAEICVQKSAVCLQYEDGGTLIKDNN